MDEKKIEPNDPGFRIIQNKDLICVGCKYAEKDVQIGHTRLIGALKITCKKFRQKPMDVLNSPSARCQYRES